ncbi:ROK family transcriptional regulator [Alphaproteobacteria bacterium KMM 3653]|uniref:ROK family transcriptional regulator n=1 Tax=Harenicola maris TaxID=2841044 RepID=A0AAP2CPY6_9RHOB|nr:ROK family transcriptional regulator [Harenicola maris]
MTPSSPQMIKGSNAERSRSSNRQAVLGRIKSAGEMGRAEIARSLGLSTQAVSNIIAELQEDGLLVETGLRSGGRGLPAMQYGVNSAGGYALGVEVRPDAIFTAILDLHGQTVVTRRRTLKSPEPAKVISKVLKLRDEMLAKTGLSEGQLLGAGVVMPGPFGQTGLSGLGSDLAGWQSVDAAALFEEALALPVELSNDANAAAMAERMALGLSHFAYLYFGAGLGLGIVNQGQLVTGIFGNAGEIGHVPVATPKGPLPLEALLSRVSVQEHLGKGPLDIAALGALFAEGDKGMMDWLDGACAALSQAVGLLENLFDPQTIILGGAMPAGVLDYLVAHTELPTLSVSNRADNPHARVQAGASGRMTATLGAAALILNRAFTPQAAAL